MSLIASLRAVVAIPARNEQDRIEACLAALRDQEGIAAGSFGILLFLNNCTDATAEVARSVAAALPRCRIIEIDHHKASAGWARRMAMDAAADWLAQEGAADGVLMTSDADSRVAPDWVRKTMDAIAAGADAVAGRIVLDEDEAKRLPASLHERGRQEAAYEQLLTEIGARLDPEPGNPWPCHWTASGATIAVRASVYRRIGGVPDMACGEDRALIDAVRANGYRVRHAMDIVVVTSGRLDGRAEGGVADTIKLRCDLPQSPCDDRLERLDRFVWRCLSNRRARRRNAVISEPASFKPLLPAALPANIEFARVFVRSLRLIDRLRAERRAETRRTAPDPRSASLPMPPP